MFRLRPEAEAVLPPEALAVCEAFLSGFAPSVRVSLRSVVLFGIHARRYDAAAEFEFLVLTESPTRELRTSVSIATEAAERLAVSASDLSGVRVTCVSRFEETNATAVTNRLLANARREGVVLWVGESAR